MFELLNFKADSKFKIENLKLCPIYYLPCPLPRLVLFCFLFF